MREQYITVKMLKTSLRLLRMIAAATGEKQFEALDRLLTAEARRLGLPMEQPHD